MGGGAKVLVLCHRGPSWISFYYSLCRSVLGDENDIKIQTAVISVYGSSSFEVKVGHIPLDPNESCGLI